MNYLIDPRNVIDYNRSDSELELFWLFCCCVAGKTASTQARLLNDFMLDHEGETPFEKLRIIGPEKMRGAVKDSRLGQYTRLARMFNESLSLDLRNCSVDDLEAIHGCGPKTARMFLMMTRPNQRLAALDTHVLKFLTSKGIDAPKVTPPSGMRYRVLEEQFVKFADESEMPVAEFDLMIWKQYSRAA